MSLARSQRDGLLANLQARQADSPQLFLRAILLACLRDNQLDCPRANLRRNRPASRLRSLLVNQHSCPHLPCKHWCHSTSQLKCQSPLSTALRTLHFTSRKTHSRAAVEALEISSSPLWSSSWADSNQSTSTLPPTVYWRRPRPLPPRPTRWCPQASPRDSPQVSPRDSPQCTQASPGLLRKGDWITLRLNPLPLSGQRAGLTQLYT
jgi:hypothetical protein